MEKQNWLVEKARWFAFIPAIWMSTLVHQATLAPFKSTIHLLSPLASAEMLTKVGILWGIAEGVTVVAAVLFAILLGPPRSPLLQVLVTTVCFIGMCSFSLTHSTRGPPVLQHAITVDGWTGVIVSLLILFGALAQARLSSRLPNVTT